jgi:DnaJ-class molecular chaperone
MPQARNNSADADRSACGPCRGTGRVLSTLGGQQHELPCPWCDGTGKFIAGRDAQASPAEQASPGEQTSPAEPA